MASGDVYRTRAAGKNSWELLRERLKNVMKPEGPRLFVFNTCRQLIRTVLAQPRHEIDVDDVDSKAEDHVGEAGIRPRGERKTSSAAARYLAFPAEHGVLGIMTEYLRAGFGESKSGAGGAEAGKDALESWPARKMELWAAKACTGRRPTRMLAARRTAGDFCASGLRT